MKDNIALIASALSLGVMWANLHYKDQMPRWVLSTALVLTVVVFLTTVAVLIDGAGYHWFRSLPPWAYFGAAILLSPVAFVATGARWPDYKKSDERQEFELYEAACYWIDREPKLPMPRKALALFREWCAAIDRGDMPAMFGHYDALDNAIVAGLKKHGPRKGEDFGPLVTVHTKVKRKVLEAWAKGRGEQPRFLCPERRA